MSLNNGSHLFLFNKNLWDRWQCKDFDVGFFVVVCPRRSNDENVLNDNDKRKVTKIFSIHDDLSKNVVSLKTLRSIWWRKRQKKMSIIVENAYICSLKEKYLSEYCSSCFTRTRNRCSLCKTIVYCNDQCRIKDSNIHKDECLFYQENRIDSSTNEFV